MTKKLAAIAAMIVLFGAAGCGDDDSGTIYAEHTAPNGERFNDADVEFASEMMQHHAQALLMVDLTVGRSLEPEVEQLAEDIRTAQSPEIAQMTTWLTDWGKPVPETVRDHANAHGEGSADHDMPGMVSEQRLAELESAKGPEFQELWLELMVEHHEGAIDMAEDQQEHGLFAPAVDLAESIETAQADEIEQMEQLLAG